MTAFDSIEDLIIDQDKVREDDNIFHTTLKEFGCDKAFDHYYTRAYCTIFLNRINDYRSIMEIGVLEGTSIQAWTKIFSRAKVVGVDNNDQYEDIHRLMIKNTGLYRMSKEQCNRLEFRYYDSTDYMLARRNLKDESGFYNIIIDDGDHNPYSQLSTFYNHIELVSPNGFYIIEDMISEYGVHLQNVVDEIVTWANNNNAVLKKYKSGMNKETHMLIIQKAVE